MDSIVQCSFRQKAFSAEVYFSFEDTPFFIFLILRDAKLAEEFGEDITIKTDLEKVLLQKNDYPELVELKRSLFTALKNTPEFWFQARPRGIVNEGVKAGKLLPGAAGGRLEPKPLRF